MTDVACRYLIAENSKKAFEFANKKKWGRIGSHKFAKSQNEFVFIPINSSSINVIYPKDIFYLAPGYQKNSMWEELSDWIFLTKAKKVFL